MDSAWLATTSNFPVATSFALTGSSRPGPPTRRLASSVSWRRNNCLGAGMRVIRTRRSSLLDVQTKVMRAAGFEIGLRAISRRSLTSNGSSPMVLRSGGRLHPDMAVSHRHPINQSRLLAIPARYHGRVPLRTPEVCEGWVWAIAGPVLIILLGLVLGVLMGGLLSGISQMGQAALGQ
jgi:hypothetical protein